MEPSNSHLPDPLVSAEDISPATRQLLAPGSDRQLGLYRNQLERRVLVLQWEIEALKSRHNSIAPVSRLPAEILYRIFLAVRTATLYTPPFRNRARWIRVTHVCQRWRSIGLDCVSLWLDLEDFMHPALMDEILTRSKNGLLSVTFHTLDGSQGARTTLQRALSRADRIRCLHLTAETSTREHLQKAISYCSANAPVLEGLTLICYGQARITLPQGLSAEGAPFVRKLEISNCGIPWCKLPITSTLTKLSLSDGKARSGKLRPTVSEFYASLRRMPSLRNLDLSGYLPTPGAICPGSAPPSPLEFPALETLCLSDHEQSVNAFFRTIRVPSSAQMHVNLLGRVQDENSLRELIQSIALSWGGARLNGSPHLKRPGIGCLELDDSLTDYKDFQASLWTTTPSENEEWDGPDLGLDFRNDGRFTAPLLRHITQYLDIGPLYHLEIKGTGDLHKEDWMMLSDCSRNLETVRITQNMSGLTTLLEALVDDTSSDSLYFHHLDKLELVDLDMVDSNVDIRNPDRDIPLAQLTDVLEWREAQDYPIFDLDLENCSGFDKSHLRALLGLSSLTIGWDGDGGFRRYEPRGQSASEGSSDLSETG